MKKNESRLIIVTGLSGSGKSVALHSLEDQGYFCIDNLSPNMIIISLTHNPTILALSPIMIIIWITHIPTILALSPIIIII